MKSILIVFIFTLTYVLIAGRKLSILPIGRPAGAMLGAVLMIVIGALSPDESYQAINHDTIILLFSTMLLTVYLENAGFFERMSYFAITLCKTPMTLLITISIFSAVLSAFLVNDTVCLFMTPVVVSICVKAKIPIGPYLIGLATSANIGSSATLVGNPQNMIIGSLSGFPFIKFLMYSGPAAIVGLIINIFLLWLYYRKDLPKNYQIALKKENDIINPKTFIFTVMILLLVILGFFAGFHMGYTSLFGCILLILYERKDPTDSFKKVDWSLLIFFSSLFIVVKAVAKTGIIDQSWTFISPYIDLSTIGGITYFSIFMTIGSQIVSNVPMVMLTGQYLAQYKTYEIGWLLLAFTTTIAGNFTLIGSVANIIVAERAKAYYTLNFWEYLKFGFISTLLVMVAGVSVFILLFNL
ncbi:MAG: anion transporter [Desulfobacterales bacterium]|nr:anion transporter [Desulfobacterales bacterium]